MSYSISLTSSCPTGNYLIDGIETEYATINHLCPNTDYTLAVRATDRVSSLYSEAVRFSTPAGVPTSPRFVLGVLKADTKELHITWVVPTESNGIIHNYEVRWTFNTLQCTDDNTGIRSQTTTVFRFVYVYNLANTDIKHYSVCVRAITTAGTLGSWGIDTHEFSQTDHLRISSQDCNVFNIVISIIVWTVLATVVMVTMLSISVTKTVLKKNY